MENMRKAVEMRMLGMTYEEIGAALGMTVDEAFRKEE
jgi:DNA-directed RNA polymerase specialized sigma24 family protein